MLKRIYFGFFPNNNTTRNVFDGEDNLTSAGTNILKTQNGEGTAFRLCSGLV